MSNKSKIVTFRMKESDYEELQIIAEKQGLTVSDYIRKLINENKGVVHNG